MTRQKNRPRARPLEEIIRRQRNDWEELFYDTFQNSFNYAWALTFVERTPPKKQPLVHYAMIRADSLFQCEPCLNKQWGSAWGWISIWYSLNRTNRNGDVYLRIFGQQCKHCASATEEKGRMYAEAIWDQNEIEDTWNTFRAEIESSLDSNVPPKPKEPSPNFGSMPAKWNDLFNEMFADFSEQEPKHKWGLVYVDRDLKGMRSLKGPFRSNTKWGAFFIWFGMGIKSKDLNSGKVFIRLLRAKGSKSVRDLEAWDLGTIEMVLYAAYQKVGQTFYDRQIDRRLPQLEVVPSFWALNMAKHQQQLCQACHEGLCQNRQGNDRMRIIYRNSSSRGPRGAEEPDE